jgi:hypothetical protein
VGENYATAMERRRAGPCRVAYRKQPAAVRGRAAHVQGPVLTRLMAMAQVAPSCRSVRVAWVRLDGLSFGVTAMPGEVRTAMPLVWRMRETSGPLWAGSQSDLREQYELRRRND